MTPLELVGVIDVPDGPPLRLLRRGADFVIALERNELMSTRMSGSEKALGTMACKRLAGRPAPHLLIGGYGMGYTLRATLGELGPTALVTVTEIVPGIVDWAHGPMAGLTGSCLDDPRVTLEIGDVADTIRSASSRYDAILLDVDNGPNGLTRPANDGIYSPAGLAAAKAALKPGGLLAVWSAAPDATFNRRLAQAGFIVDETRVRARSNGKGPTHTIWFAKRR